jgi:hypothetical protein|tara:strand:- start:42725 stop:43726 length:1002 start_codon:yes stop_codon:yes gene_type:complete
MRILYIDNRRYGHNADLHIDFISHISKKKYHRVIGFGRHLNKYLAESVIPSGHVLSNHLDKVLARYNPDLILTYNCNGSSYEIGQDNVNLYKWISKYLSRVDLPKFHVTTDYCRSGFRQDQADWFSDIGYSASFFRHKVALDYPLSVDKYWLPFSVNKDLYSENIDKNLKNKSEKVGFLGAAHNSSKKLYKNRISAINLLRKNDMLKITKVLDAKYTRKMLFGDEYVRFWTNNLFGLTCGGTCNFMTAKYFQIPASYSMLVCTDTVGLDILPKDTYITYSKKNIQELIPKLLYHIDNKDITREKIDRLHNHVMKKHNHHTRILEMTEIFKKYV